MNNTNIEHDNYEGNLVATSGPSNDGLLTLTFEVSWGLGSIKKCAMDFLGWFDKDTISEMKCDLKKHIDKL